MNIHSILGFVRSIVVYRLNFVGQWRMRRLYRQFVKPGDLVFDVGAHVGDRIWALRSLDCHVVAIEPQPLFMRFLRKLYGLASNVSLEFCALGAQDGSGEILVSSRNPTLSSLSSDWVNEIADVNGFRHVLWDGCITVEISTLDSLIARYGLPAFCKIDVEGYEINVLKGLTHPVPVLSFEFLSSQRSRAIQCLERISDLGDYDFNISYGEYLAFIRPDWCTQQDIIHHIEQLPDRVSSGDVYARLKLNSI